MSKYKDFTNLAADFAWETDLHGNITYITGKKRFGYQNSQLVGLEATKLLHKSSSPGSKRYLTSKKPLADAELVIKQANGAPEHSKFQQNLFLIRTDFGGVQGELEKTLA